jgi:hypothetical protein
MSGYSYTYTAIPPARGIHNSTAKITMVVAGARSGKTRASLGGELARVVMLQPGYWRSDIEARVPYTIIVCEPTFKMVRTIAWGTLKNAIPAQNLINENLTDRILHYQGVHGVTQIICASYEQGSEKIEGLSSVYFAFLDEIFQCQQQFYNEVLVRLSERNGRAILTGTPKPALWLEDEVINRALDGDPDFKYITWKTSENPYFPKESLATMRRILPPKIFRRNYEASLESFDGQIYEEFDKSIHAQVWDINPDEYQVIWGSQDWGFSHNGSFYVYGLRDDDQVDILFEVSESGIPPVAAIPGQRCWASIMEDYQNQFEEKFDWIYAGPDRPENIENIRSIGVQIKGADNAVNEGITFVAALMHVEEGRSKLRIHSANCPKLVRRIPTYRWDIDSSGRVTEKPLKQDDDEVDSMRYGLYSQRRWFRIWQKISGGVE